MVKLGNLSTDGTKMGANASRHKAMSYGYMDKEIERLEAEIEQLLKEAEQTDAEQDAALGSRAATNCPTELKRREERLAKIREAKARLEAEAAAAAEAEQHRRDEAEAERAAEGRKRRGKEPAPIDPTPEDKAQTNFTDPEVKIMKQSNKGFEYSCNAQVVVDGAHQIIVAAGGDPRGQRQAAGGADGAERRWPTWRRRGSSGRGRPTGRRRRSRTRRTPATSARKRWRDWSSWGWTRTSPPSGRSTMRRGGVGADGCGTGSECQGEDAAEAAHGGRQGAVRGAEADRRTGVRPDQGGAGHPPVSVAGPGEGLGRMATDLPDPQSAEDLASRLRLPARVEGEVRAEGGAEAERAETRRKPRGQGETRANSRTGS